MINYLKLMRPRHWIKNLAVLAGPVFAMRLDGESLAQTAIVFVVFCLASSATYAINDIIDRKADAQHPVKKNRPLAVGSISPLGASVWALMLLVLSGMVSTWLLSPQTTIIVAAYFIINLAYSLALKHRMILDVILIAIGFVLRATAGAAAIHVSISPWLIVCTFTLCMFLGFGKRRCEIAIFDSPERAKEHRRTLVRYTPELLAHLISVSAGIAIMTFLLYTMDRDPAYAPPFNKHHLLYTIPLVVYGLFRYAMIIQTGDHHGPVDIILHDRPLLGTIIIWGLLALAIMTEDRWVDAVGLGQLLQGAGVPDITGEVVP